MIKITQREFELLKKAFTGLKVFSDTMNEIQKDNFAEELLSKDRDGILNFCDRFMQERNEIGVLYNKIFENIEIIPIENENDK